MVDKTLLVSRPSLYIPGRRCWWKIKRPRLSPAVGPSVVATLLWWCAHNEIFWCQVVVNFFVFLCVVINPHGSCHCCPLKIVEFWQTVVIFCFVLVLSVIIIVTCYRVFRFLFSIVSIFCWRTKNNNPGCVETWCYVNMKNQRPMVMFDRIGSWFISMLLFGFIIITMITMSLSAVVTQVRLRFFCYCKWLKKQQRLLFVKSAWSGITELYHKHKP